MVGDGGGYIAKEQEGNSLSEGNVLYLDWDGDCTGICQMSSNRILRNECILLHVYYTSIKLEKTKQKQPS